MKQRLITGSFIVLATVLAIVAKFLPLGIGDYVFDIFALIIAIIAGFEMTNIMEKMGKNTNKFMVTMFSVFHYAVLLVSMKLVKFYWIVIIELLALIVYFVATLIVEATTNKNGFKSVFRVCFNTILSCLYPAFMFCTIVIINHSSSFAGVEHFSTAFLIMIFAITYFTDTFAYLVGRTLKGPKLAPKISPNKTISGSIGGLLGGVGASMLVYLLISKTSWCPILEISSLSWWHFLALGAVASVLGQCGDLFESALKRKAGIKDSGNLFPGHGGMLDRYDALTFVSTFVFIFVLIVLI